MERTLLQVVSIKIQLKVTKNVTDIYGAVFIDSKIEENIINENEDWKQYMIVFQNLCKLAKREKLKKLNG